MNNEQQKVTWVDKIVVTLIHCLRDWLITLPIQQMMTEGSLSLSTLNSVFEVSWDGRLSLPHLKSPNTLALLDKGPHFSMP